MQTFRNIRVGWHRFILVGVFLLSIAVSGTASAQSDASATGVVHKVQATGIFTFAPKAITIAVGDTVVWINTASSSSGIPHTVTSATGAWTSSPTILPGGTFHVTFTKAGTYGYYCKVHVATGMKGQIIVQ
jgi:plastocyanin